MAEFCRQCSIRVFGEDMRDFVGITRASHTKRGTYALVICEGCGPTSVDHEGVCVSPECDEKHGLLPKEPPEQPAPQQP